MSDNTASNGRPAQDADFFGIDTPISDAHFQLIAVPWEATVSYRRGTAHGPDAMRCASHQIDLLDPNFGDLCDLGWCSTALDVDAHALSARAQALVEHSRQTQAVAQEVDELYDEVMGAVGRQLRDAFAHGRTPIVLGGDHSVAFAGIQEAYEQSAFASSLAVLQIDAHADLREAYEGYRSSHASVIRNVVEEIPQARVFQVGIRDFCDEECEAIKRHHITTVFDRTLADARQDASVPALLHRLVQALPEHVWLTIDIDGLDPSLCPNTGTPVPGGLRWDDIVLLLEMLARERSVIGADLVEVSPGHPRPAADTWDAIIGARLLYKVLGTIAKRTRPALPELL